MGKETGISWCDATFNPWRGCVKVSEGCANCYAEQMSHRNPAVLGEWGPGSVRAIGTDAYWDQPLAWDRAAERAGVRKRVFCLSLGDVFESRDDLINLRVRLFELIDRTPNLDWLLVTKRPDVAKAWVAGSMLQGLWGPDGMGPPNVWLGVSVENQARADERIPILLKIPAAVRFVSYEPALGPVDWRTVQHNGEVEIDSLSGNHGVYRPLAGRSANHLDWIICGGESGSKARPFDLAWARSTRDQCAAAGVAFFMKQTGANLRWRPKDGPCESWPDHVRVNYQRGGAESEHRILLAHRSGADPAEWPDDLRIQQFPRLTMVWAPGESRGFPSLPLDRGNF